MTRLVAFDKKSKTFVNVSLRKESNDLTNKNINIPSYIHRNRRTISGRLILNKKNMYEFIEL
jgi:hypothetical protein